MHWASHQTERKCRSGSHPPEQIQVSGMRCMVYSLPALLSIVVFLRNMGTKYSERKKKRMKGGPSLDGFLAYCRERKLDMGYGFEINRTKYYQEYLKSL